MKKFFTKYTTVAFILGLVVMFGSGYCWQEGAVCAGKNVGVVTIIGNIDVAEDLDNYLISAPATVQLIEQFDADPDIKAIVLNIDSPGGLTESSESVMFAIKGVSKP